MISGWLRILIMLIMFSLFVLMLYGLALFLAGPEIMIKDFTESDHGAFTLEPYGNKTIGIPLSLEQAFYMVPARNLMLRNVVLVEINGSRSFTVYQLKDNTTVKLAEHTQFYSSNLSNIGIKAELIVENEANETMEVEINIKHVLTAKTADFTIPHKGFIIFITTLLTLQLLSVATNGDTLIGSTLNRIAFKLRRKNIDTRKTFLKATAFTGFVFEIFTPMLLCIIIYALMEVYGRGLSLVEGGYILDYEKRLVLIVTLLCYFFSILIDASQIMYQSIIVWILKRKGQEFLRIYEEIHKLLKGVKAIFPLVLIILIAAVIMLACGLELEIILGTAFCLSPILFYIAIHVEIKHLQARLRCDSFNENLAGFMEIGAKTIGFWVLEAIAIFAAFTMTMPLFSALISNMLLLEYYPSFLYKSGQTAVSMVNDAFTLLGQLQIPLCLVFASPYWITRVMICKFKAKYKLRLLTDIAIFFAVFGVSEYLNWTYSFFTQKQPYDVAGIPISILISMAASILNDLLTEIKPK